MRILIAGIGNIFMRDDGCGSFLAEALEGKVEADVQDFGTGGISLVDELEKYDVIIILDIADINEDIKVFEVNDINEDDIVQTVLSMSFGGSHGLGIEDILTILKSKGSKVKIILLTCKPKILNPGIGLSDECLKNAFLAIDELEKILKQFNVKVDRNEIKEALISRIRRIR
ncbi:hydrogenase maturation protease [Acidianus brierleyi]|uniref:Hydrogenase maturation protease n=1 Tax=Acidianus brierleyi TaxID=41673 RepID=A0A2U9IHT3_9CREN|nr:hydrogenase maturation protease [Acidianus brierleyi]AWR95546.1 hydrogenase maturation protease [Acidianus brierleyi]